MKKFTFVLALLVAGIWGIVRVAAYSGYNYTYNAGGYWPLVFGQPSPQNIPLTIGDILSPCAQYIGAGAAPVMCDTQIQTLDLVHPIALVTGVNLNASTPADTAFLGVGVSAPASYLITEIRVRNCSHAATGATLAIYTATSGGGIPITTSQSPQNSASTDDYTLTLASGIATTDLTASTWYVHLTGAEGAATTCDFWIYGKAFT